MDVLVKIITLFTALWAGVLVGRERVCAFDDLGALNAEGEGQPGILLRLPTGLRCSAQRGERLVLSS